MPNATVALDLSETTNVLLNLATQWSFNSVILIQVSRNATHLIFGQLTSTDVRIHSQFEANLNSKDRSNAVKISQGNVDRLIIRYVDAKHAGHCKSPLQIQKRLLALTLFVSRI
jgi:hypothetical protein